MKAICYLALLSCLCLLGGCTQSTQSARTQATPTGSTPRDAASNEPDGNEFASCKRSNPVRGAEKEAQEALILAEAGDTIEFAQGTFEFKGTLSLNGTANITIRGQGMDKTILNFSGQRSGSGGEGLKIKGDNFTIVDLCLQNAPGDAIKVEDSNRVTFRRVKTTWTRGPSEQNGAYGIYPVLCSDVLIEHCVAECASDAGIYVGQTQRAIVRYNRAERNVAGIEN